MKAWLIDGYAGVGGLRLAGDHPVPKPAAGEVLVRVAFAALNPADRYLAEKQYPARPTFPHILGRDAYGFVEAVGEGVHGWAVGAPAIILRGDAGVNKPGTFAEFVTIPQDRLAVPPAAWKPEEAAGAPLVFLTAWQALNCWQIPGGHDGAWLLVTGASGGVGSAAVMLGRALGMRPIALSRDAAKTGELRRIGAAEVFSSDDPDLGRRVKELTADRGGVALAVDSIGGAGFETLLGALADGGAISCVGRLAGPVPEFNTARLFFKRLRIGGVSVGAYTPAEAAASWAQVVAALNRGGARPLVDQVFPMEELPAAFERLAKGPLGKVLIRVAG